MENKILLVEDDQNFGDVLRSYLEMHDYDVTLATDGEAGLEAFKKGTFNLCITDVMMPKKMVLPWLKISGQLIKKRQSSFLLPKH